ncbi:MAG TPA: DUF1570 domain-containing protein [Kofleriaceae bacterium]|nr:DUF1570 domain-containing protein [Kofleriaceae bacterium]
MFGVFGFVWIAACSAVIRPLPSKGGPAWVELKTAHFTMWTDAPAERGRRLVREMERRRQVIMTAMNHAPSTSTAFVIALDSKREVDAYLPAEFAASAWPPDPPIYQPGILLAATGEDSNHAVSHELAHVISFAVIRNQPAWFAEGLATYFEMVDLDHGESSVQIGIPRDDRSTELRRSRPLPVATLFACTEPRCEDGRFYATSWLVFSYLLNEHFDQFSRYLQYLNEHPHGKPDEAWRAVFPALTPSELDATLLTWIRSGAVRLPHIEVTTQDFPSTERSLGDADVLAARSLLALGFKNDAAAVRTLSEAALALDRTHLLARLVNIAVTQNIAPDDARATAAAHPDDWRAWRLVAFALSNTPEGAVAYERMCTLSGNAAAGCAQRSVSDKSSR